MKKTLLMATLLSSLSFAAYAGGNIEAGKEAAKKFNCASCHGENYSKPLDPAYPKLAGQHADYLAQSLYAYQRGADGAYGRSNPTMVTQAKALSSKDIQNIAAYLQSLPSELVLKK